MKRLKAFSSSLTNPKYINDSRFGLRKLFLTEQEQPTIATYMNPGRGASGEHQN